MKKKLLGVLLALTTCFSLTGCNKATLKDLDSQIKSIEESVIRGDLANKEFKLEEVDTYYSGRGIIYRDGDVVYMYLDNAGDISKTWFVRKGVQYYEYSDENEEKTYKLINQNDYSYYQNLLVNMLEAEVANLKSLYNDCEEGNAVCYVEKNKKDVYTFYTKASDGLDYVYELQYGKILSVAFKGVKRADSRTYDVKYIFTYGEQNVSLPDFNTFVEED